MLYAVKGKLGKGEGLVLGTMLDLKLMQEAGEGIYNIQVSDEEMKNVISYCGEHVDLSNRWLKYFRLWVG